MKKILSDLDWRQRLRLRTVAEYGAVAALSLGILWWLMELQHANLRVPFSYGGDGQSFVLYIKGIIDNGWFLTNPYVGMPYGLKMHDFPLSDNFTFLLIKLLSLFTHDVGLIFNLYFILHFPLTALTAYFVFRHFNAQRWTAIVGSLLYTFIPFHITRSQGHVLYAAFYAVPLIVMVMLWLGMERLTLGTLRQHKGRLAATVLICLLLASTGSFYYAFFACALLLSTGLLLAFRHRHLKQLLLPVALIIFIVFGITINVFPSLLYFQRHGTVGTFARNASDAEIMGLKIGQLLLPIPGHRVRFLADLKQQHSLLPFTSENADTSLGVIGSIGFLTLLGWLLYRRRSGTPPSDDERWRLIDHLSVLNLTALLIGTIGGFGALVAFLALPQIRSYNRIVVYIAFFAFFTLVLLFDRFVQQWQSKKWIHVTCNVLLGCVLMVGIMDQVSPALARLAYEGLNDVYTAERDFVRRVEATQAEGAMIFQFPCAQFPEAGSQEQMMDYDLFKGYIHSRKLRWSYGAMRGRSSDLWQRQLIDKPLPVMVQDLVYAGFSGIYIDRFGYKDKAAEMESQFAKLLSSTPLVSRNERLSFFDLTNYKKNLQAGQARTEWEQKQEQALFPILSAWRTGFYDLEGEAGNSWRWCQKSGELYLINGSTQPKLIALQLTLRANNEGEVIIRSKFFSEQFPIGQTPQLFNKTITVPPGEHRIRFACNAPKAYAPKDPRKLVFQVGNFKLSRSE